MNRIHTVYLADTLHPVFSDKLTAAGFDIIPATDIPPEAFPVLLKNPSVLAIRSRFKIDRSFIDACPNLSVIARAGSGMENIDTSYAQIKNIICLNSPEGNRDSVAEHAIGMLLMLMNNLHLAHKQVSEGVWDRISNRGNEINGKTIGIIGFGNTGSALAMRLNSFGCRILAYDKYKSKNEITAQGVLAVPPETIYKEADIVSLHLPLNDETRNMVSSEWLNSFSKPIWLINTSRGPIVNTKDLYQAICEGKVRGAALDVLEYEETAFENLQSRNLPDYFYQFVSSGKVVLSPHIAGWTHESNQKIASVLADKILAELG